ncbi:MAG: hypothetical protein ACHQF4_02460 [Sphingobacteriales bacterium]|jgi:hypothetical protein
MNEVTKGEWIVDNHRSVHVIYDSQQQLATVYTGVETATLMAASKELLEALEKAVKDYGNEGGPWNVPSEPGTWIEMAKSAIQKAKSIK